MNNLVIGLYILNKCAVVLFLDMGIYLGLLDANLTIVYVRYMKWFVIYVQLGNI